MQLTVDDLAATLGVHPSWVYERTRLNLIPHRRYGRLIRFDPEDVAAIKAAAASDGSGPAPRGARR